jgi:hypothetical protein
VFLRPLPDIMRGLTAGGIALQFTLLIFAFLLVVGLFGAALLLVSWRLAHADRVARGLTYVLLGGVAASILVGDDKRTTLVIVMLVCAAAIAVLALSPAVEAFLRGSAAPQGGQPTGLVTARTLVAAWAACCALVGFMLLPIGGLGAKFVLVGLALIALAGAAFWLNGRLAEGVSSARLVVTGGGVVYVVLMLVLGDRSPGAVLPLALVVGILWNLWIPDDTRRYFENRGWATR